MSMSKPDASTAGLGTEPLRYQPAYEQTDGDEAQTSAELTEVLSKIQRKVYEDSGRGTRGVHAKSHGLLTGELRVMGGLSPHLAQGLFAEAARFPVVMRLSTIPGDVLDDAVSTPRGMAVKVIGVDGARVPGSEQDRTQDFVLVDGPAFSTPHARKFLSSLKLLASTTDRAPGLKKILSTVMRGAEKALEAVGGQSSTLMTLGGYPEIHPLGDTYYSQAPILFGDYMAKICIAPVSASLTALIKRAVDLKGKPDGLRDAVVEFFKSQSAEWEVRAQLCTDLASMPIEDASVVWPETMSPYVPVARIAMQPQAAWSPARTGSIDEGMAFSPWHALAAHRPLGTIMRVRKTVYETTARLRADRNARSISEPRSMADVKL
jgi:hypothetical protein